MLIIHNLERLKNHLCWLIDLQIQIYYTDKYLLLFYFIFKPRIFQFVLYLRTYVELPLYIQSG